jgi:hypothetical protein
MVEIYGIRKRQREHENQDGEKCQRHMSIFYNVFTILREQILIGLIWAINFAEGHLHSQAVKVNQICSEPDWLVSWIVGNLKLSSCPTSLKPDTLAPPMKRDKVFRVILNVSNDNNCKNRDDLLRFFGNVAGQ